MFSHRSPPTTRCTSAGTIGISAGGRGEGRSHVVLEDGDYSENNLGDAGRSNHNYRMGSNRSAGYQYPATRNANRASSAPIRKQSDRMRGHQEAPQNLQRQRSAVGCLQAGAAATAIDASNRRRGVCVPVTAGCEPLGQSRRNNIMHTSMVNQSQGHSCGANFPPRVDHTRKAVGEGVDSRQTKSAASLPGLPIPRGAPRQPGMIFPGFGQCSRPGSRESGGVGSRRDQRRPPRPVRCSFTHSVALPRKSVQMRPFFLR